MQRMIQFLGLVCAIFALADAAFSSPRVYTFALVVTDRVDPGSLSPKLQQLQPPLIETVGRALQTLCTDLGRCHSDDWLVLEDREEYVPIDGVPVDFVVQLFVHQFGKIYRNQVISRQSGRNVPGTHDPYEVLSYPAISGRFELRLIDYPRNRVRWSAMRDSTVIVPYNQYRFLYNPEKYPGWTHPALLREHMADLARLQHYNPSVGNFLNAADVWFVSSPSDDVAVAQRLLADLVASFYQELDGNLPLEGRIATVLPDTTQETLVRLDIGARHGLVVGLRLEVLRSLPADEKVGQLEIVQVDSTTAMARLHRLERAMRRRGEGVQAGDRVISRTRGLSHRRR